MSLKAARACIPGFFQAYWPIQKDLFDAVETLVHTKARPVYITGHSLGAALATMATAELANHPKAWVRDSIAACYTFGSPRVGDSTFDMYVKVPLYRVTNGIDPVPVVPFWFMGYRHVGDTRYFGQQGTAPSRYSINVFRRHLRTAIGLLSFLRTMKIVTLRITRRRAYIGKMLAWAEKNIAETKERREDTTTPKMPEGYDKGSCDG